MADQHAYFARRSKLHFTKYDIFYPIVNSLYIIKIAVCLFGFAYSFPNEGHVHPAIAEISVYSLIDVHDRVKRQLWSYPVVEEVMLPVVVEEPVAAVASVGYYDDSYDSYDVYELLRK